MISHWKIKVLFTNMLCRIYYSIIFRLYIFFPSYNNMHKSEVSPFGFFTSSLFATYYVYFLRGYGYYIILKYYILFHTTNIPNTNITQFHTVINSFVVMFNLRGLWQFIHNYWKLYQIIILLIIKNTLKNNQGISYQSRNLLLFLAEWVVVDCGFKFKTNNFNNARRTKSERKNISHPSHHYLYLLFYVNTEWIFYSIQNNIIIIKFMFIPSFNILSDRIFSKQSHKLKILCPN